METIFVHFVKHEQNSLSRSLQFYEMDTDFLMRSFFIIYEIQNSTIRIMYNVHNIHINK